MAKPTPVAIEAKKIPGVDTAEVVFGPYDVLTRVVADDVDSLGKLVVTKIQAIDGVIRTLTCQVIHI